MHPEPRLLEVVGENDRTLALQPADRADNEKQNDEGPDDPPIVE